MSAYPDGGQTVYRVHGHVDGSFTYDGEVSYVYEYKSTTTGTHATAPIINKWDDSPKIKWYSLELPPRKKEEPVRVFHHVVPKWEREWTERVRVSDQRSVRDTRQAVWACRPRHGLSGR